MFLCLMTLYVIFSAVAFLILQKQSYTTYSNLYNPFLKYGGGPRVYIFRVLKYDYMLIYLCGSDGGGGYGVLWIFKNGKYITRIVEELC